MGYYKVFYIIEPFEFIRRKTVKALVYVSRYNKFLFHMTVFNL